MISFEQKGKFSGEIGEDIILLEYKKENWVFTKQYKIIDINQKKFDDDYTNIEITTEFIREFEDKKFLDDYVFSLVRVTDFKNPYRHFYRKYSRLTDVEFEAIVDDKIYTNRTILGIILKALHIDHQKSFIEYLAQEEPALLANKPDVDKSLNYLYKYIEANIIEPINYLKSSGELFSNIIGYEELNELGFAEDAEKLDKLKMVKPQLDLIKEYLQYFSLMDRLKDDTTKSATVNNKAFRNLFKYSRLPLNLK
jgi:hypothetical protein